MLACCGDGVIVVGLFAINVQFWLDTKMTGNLAKYVFFMSDYNECINDFPRE